MTEISIEVMSDPYGDRGNAVVMIYMGESEGPDRWECGNVYRFNIRHLQEFIRSLRSIGENGRIAKCIDLDDKHLMVFLDPHLPTIKVAMRGGYYAEAVFPMCEVSEIADRLEYGLRDCTEGKA